MTTTVHSRERSDCAVVALARATGRSYDECYRALADCGRKSSHRTHGYTVEKAIRKLGYKTKARRPGATMKTVHNHAPVGRPAVILCTGHFVAWDGEKVFDDFSTTTRRKIRIIYDIITD